MDDDDDDDDDDDIERCDQWSSSGSRPYTVNLCPLTSGGHDLMQRRHMSAGSAICDRNHPNDV